MIQDFYTAKIRLRAVRTTDSKGNSSIVWGKSITNITKGTTTSIQCNSHGYSTGNSVYFSDIVGMTELNGTTHEITVVDVNNFTIAVNSSSYSSYTSGGLTNLSFMGLRQSRSGVERDSADRVTNFYREVLYTDCSDLKTYDRIKDGSDIFEIINISQKNDVLNSVHHYQVNLTEIK